MSTTGGDSDDPTVQPGAPSAPPHSQFSTDEAPVPTTLIPLRQMLVSTMNDVPGHEVTAVLGEVFGLTVRSRHLFSTFGAGFRTIFGGEARGFTKLLAETRLDAVQRLRQEAAALGANAIVAMRFDTGEFAGTMNEVAAYGTAVILRPLPPGER